MERRVKEIVETRVREELERRKDEIENEVKRRVDVLKRSMEKQMLSELEKRNNDEIRRLVTKEVSSLSAPNTVASLSCRRRTKERNAKISSALLRKTNGNWPKQKSVL